MRVLLTGASGRVGPAVIRALDGVAELRLFSRRRIDSGHEQVLGDLCSLDDCLAAAEGIDVLVHLAAYPEPHAEAFRFNLESTYALAEAARRQGVGRILFASTNCVYGHCYPVSPRPFVPEALPIDEAHPCRPEDNYGLSKRLCEQMLATFSRTWGIRTASLRLCWVWGEEERAWRRALGPLDEDKYARYFWAYVDERDCAAAFRTLAEAAEFPLSGEYNISAPDHMSELDTEELADRYYPGIPQQAPLRGRPTFFSNAAAFDAFGYAPRYSWRDR